MVKAHNSTEFIPAKLLQTEFGPECMRNLLNAQKKKKNHFTFRLQIDPKGILKYVYLLLQSITVHAERMSKEQNYDGIAIFFEECNK